MAKCYELAVRTPQGAAEIAAAHWWQRGLLHAAMALPALCCLLWVRSFTSLHPVLSSITGHKSRIWKSHVLPVCRQHSASWYQLSQPA